MVGTFPRGARTKGKTRAIIRREAQENEQEQEKELITLSKSRFFLFMLGLFAIWFLGFFKSCFLTQISSNPI
jgi:hypothetical protein